ncbi:MULTISPECIES: LysR family transcriptional regulator substrate-binding protein [Streptomyces]|uniref:LysR family transcriptional regulator substrate-binding protein n=1 Tax=Streptomyces TaxID=1883 RepID=UPI00345BF87F
MRAALERGCARAGFLPRVTFEAAAPHVLAQLAARGLGIAVLPAGEDEPTHHGQLRTLWIARPEMRARIALAWQTNGPSSPVGPGIPRPPARSPPEAARGLVLDSSKHRTPYPYSQVPERSLLCRIHAPCAAMGMGRLRVSLASKVTPSA